MLNLITLFIINNFRINKFFLVKLLDRCIKKYKMHCFIKIRKVGRNFNNKIFFYDCNCFIFFYLLKHTH